MTDATRTSTTSLELQSRFVMQNLKKTAAAAGIDLGKDIVRIYQWFTSPYPTMDGVRRGKHLAPHLDHSLSRHPERVHLRATTGLYRNGDS